MGIKPKNCLEAVHFAKKSALEFAWRETLEKLHDGQEAAISRRALMTVPEGPCTKREESQIAEIEIREALSKAVTNQIPWQCFSHCLAMKYLLIKQVFILLFGDDVFDLLYIWYGEDIVVNSLSHWVIKNIII